MSADFRTEPFRFVYDRLTELEAEMIGEQLILGVLRKRNAAALERIRDLQDVVRPTTEAT